MYLANKAVGMSHEYICAESFSIIRPAGRLQTTVVLRILWSVCRIEALWHPVVVWIRCHFSALVGWI